MPLGRHVYMLRIPWPGFLRGLAEAPGASANSTALAGQDLKRCAMHAGLPEAPGASTNSAHLRTRRCFMLGPPPGGPALLVRVPQACLAAGPVGSRLTDSSRAPSRTLVVVSRLSPHPLLAGSLLDGASTGM